MSLAASLFVTFQPGVWFAECAPLLLLSGFHPEPWDKQLWGILTLTHLLQAGHSGHGRAVSRGSAEVGGAAGPLPAAFLGRFHAATRTTGLSNCAECRFWWLFCRCATWHRRCAPCRGHTRGIGPFSWSPSSQPPPRPAGSLRCDPRRRIPPPG